MPKVSELLDRPEKWTKGANARYAQGAECSQDDPRAICWCLLGAVRYCYGLDDRIEILLRLERRLGCDPVQWNDAPNRTYEEVIAVVKELDI